MKKRFANSANNGQNIYKQKRVNRDYFKGYVSYLKMINVNNPMVVTVENKEVCLLDENYIWYEVYPDNDNYAITIMYDDKGDLIQWYFDISKSIGVKNGIPYEEDLYLDMLIKPNGEMLVLDEDELEEALKNKDITKEDYELAYDVLEKLKNEYANNFDYLVSLTERLKVEI